MKARYNDVCGVCWNPIKKGQEIERLPEEIVTWRGTYKWGHSICVAFRAQHPLNKCEVKHGNAAGAKL